MTQRANRIKNIDLIRAYRGDALTIDLGKQYDGVLQAWLKKRNADAPTFRRFDIIDNRYLYLPIEKTSDYYDENDNLIEAVKGKWLFDVTLTPIDGTYEDEYTIITGVIKFENDITGSKGIEIAPNPLQNSFLGLTDTPFSYEESGQVVIINEQGNGLVFANPLEIGDPIENVTYNFDTLTGTFQGIITLASGKEITNFIGLDGRYKIIGTEEPIIVDQDEFIGNGTSIAPLQISDLIARTETVASSAVLNGAMLEFKNANGDKIYEVDLISLEDGSYELKIEGDELLLINKETGEIVSRTPLSNIVAGVGVELGLIGTTINLIDNNGQTISSIDIKELNTQIVKNHGYADVNDLNLNKIGLQGTYRQRKAIGGSDYDYIYQIEYDGITYDITTTEAENIGALLTVANEEPNTDRVYNALKNVFENVVGIDFCSRLDFVAGDWVIPDSGTFYITGNGVTFDRSKFTRISSRKKDGTGNFGTQMSGSEVTEEFAPFYLNDIEAFAKLNYVNEVLQSSKIVDVNDNVLSNNLDGFNYGIKIYTDETIEGNGTYNSPLSIADGQFLKSHTDTRNITITKIIAIDEQVGIKGYEETTKYIDGSTETKYYDNDGIEVSVDTFVYGDKIFTDETIEGEGTIEVPLSVNDSLINDFDTTKRNVSYINPAYTDNGVEHIRYTIRAVNAYNGGNVNLEYYTYNGVQYNTPDGINAGDGIVFDPVVFLNNFRLQFNSDTGLELPSNKYIYFNDQFSDDSDKSWLWAFKKDDFDGTADPNLLGAIKWLEAPNAENALTGTNDSNYKSYYSLGHGYEKITLNKDVVISTEYFNNNDVIVDQYESFVYQTIPFTDDSISGKGTIEDPLKTEKSGSEYVKQSVLLQGYTQEFVDELFIGLPLFFRDAPFALSVVRRSGFTPCNFVGLCTNSTQIFRWNNGDPRVNYYFDPNINRQVTDLEFYTKLAKNWEILFGDKLPDPKFWIRDGDNVFLPLNGFGGTADINTVTALQFSVSSGGNSTNGNIIRNQPITRNLTVDIIADRLVKVDENGYEIEGTEKFFLYDEEINFTGTWKKIDGTGDLNNTGDGGYYKYLTEDKKYSPSGLNLNSLTQSTVTTLILKDGDTEISRHDVNNRAWTLPEVTLLGRFCPSIPFFQNGIETTLQDSTDETVKNVVWNTETSKLETKEVSSIFEPLPS